MRGTQEIRVSSRRLDYRLALRRNITVVCGDSATGKTTLFDMVADHARLGRDSGVNLSCPKPCVALVDIDWENQLSNTRDSIVFVDEGFPAIASREFASAMKRTDNYYVLITRQSLHELPYSVDEVYHMKASGKYHVLEPAYPRHRGHVYGSAPGDGASYDTLLTEDSRSGFQFFDSRCGRMGVSCESAGTKSGILGWLKENRHAGTVFVVADGAAFGSEADRILKYQREHPEQVAVCLPESFEWLILNSRLVKADDLEDVLENTGDYVDSAEHFSWERFLEAYLREISAGTQFRYSKSRLADAYRAERNAERVIAPIANGNIR